MNNSINTLTDTKKNLEDLINEQNLLIFDEENWINKDLWKIAEVTYSYDSDTWINTTLFVKWWNLDLENYKKENKNIQKKLLLKAEKKLKKILNNKKEQIEEGIRIVELMDEFSKESIEMDIKDIFINSLLEKKGFLDYSLNAIPFELEKAWIINDLSKNDKLKLEQNQETLDYQLFWWKIKDNREETKLSYEYILDKYTQNQNNLTNTEKQKFEWYLLKARNLLPKSYKYKSKSKPKLILWDFLNLDIPKKDYILWFNIIIESLEKLWHTAKSNKDVKSISDGPHWIEFPTTPEFDFMKTIRFLRLSDHEIETHSLIDYNSKQLIWNMRWKGSTEKDEWVAMLMEQLFMYWNELYKIDEDWDQIIDISKIQINSYFTKTLMWEILDNDELLDFLELSNKIDPDIISVIDRYLRLKRNNEKWVQHKDTTYTRWLLKAIEEINIYIKSKWKQWISPEDLFLGKISFEETSKLKNIKETKQKNWEKIDIMKPLFISDAVYFAITEKLEWREWNITWESFYKYLQEKYPIFNFTQEQIKEVSYKTKRNVFWVVNILLKNIWEQQIKSVMNKQKQLYNILWNQYNFKISNTKNKLHPSRKNIK